MSNWFIHTFVKKVHWELSDKSDIILLQVTKNAMFWDWVKQELLPSLYDTQWYNGEPFEYEEGYLSNREVFMVGMPRLRQLRLRPGNLSTIIDVQ